MVYEIVEKRRLLLSLLFAIVLAGLPLAILSATQTTDKRYVIFDANPRNVSETDGANAYPSGAGIIHGHLVRTEYAVQAA